MILSVTWVGATREPTQRTKVELTYRNALLELFHSPECAKKSHDYYVTHPQTPFQDWARFTHYAHSQAIRELTPCEKAVARFRVDFDN